MRRERSCLQALEGADEGIKIYQDVGRLLSGVKLERLEARS